MDLHLQDNLINIVDPDINQCMDYSNRCAVALEEVGHQPIVSLELTGDFKETYNINWITPRTAGYRNSDKNTELGAVALSFLFANDLLGYDFFLEGIYGEGIDYWMALSETKDGYDPMNHLQARLEVSGISKESSTNTVIRRVGVKVPQTDPTDYTGLTAYISVVEFNTPKATFKRK